MTIKAALLAVLVGLVPAALVTAEGNGEWPGGGEWPDGDPMTITWMSRFPDSAGERHLEEKFGVNIESNGVWPFHEWEKEESLLASGQLPDAFPIGKLDDLMAYRFIRPIPIDMIREYMPRYTALMDERPLGWLLSRNPDNQDEMMRINSFRESANGILIWTSFRADHAERLGMGLPGYQDGKVALDTSGVAYSYDIDLPLSWFEDLLVAFRDGDIDGNGWDDTIPMSGHRNMAWMWAPVLGAFGLHHNFSVGASGVTNYYEDGKTHLQPISERYRDFLRHAAKWYAMGLIDKEFPVLSRRRAWEKIQVGSVGLTFGTFPGDAGIKNRPPTAFVPEDGFGSTYAEVVVVPPPIGPNKIQGGGNSLISHDGVGYGGGLFINRSVGDEKLAKILQILDYYKLDPEGRFLGQYGIPDVHFTWQGEPFKSAVIRTPKDEVPAGGWPQNGDFAMYPIISPWTHSQMSFPREVARFYSHYVVDGRGPDLQMRTYRWDIFGETDMPTISQNYGEKLNTIFNEFYFNAITGHVDVEAEWDNYVARWARSGGDAIIEIASQWHVVDEYMQGKISYDGGERTTSRGYVPPPIPEPDPPKEPWISIAAKKDAMIGIQGLPLVGKDFILTRQGQVIGKDGPIDLTSKGMPILTLDGKIILDSDGMPDDKDTTNWPHVPSSNESLPPVHVPDTLPISANCGPATACGPSAGPINSGTGGIDSGGGNDAAVGTHLAIGQVYTREAATDSVGSAASIYNRLSFPTAVALRYEHDSIKCSGVLVSERHILTAAHCVCNRRPFYAFFGETVWFFRGLVPGLRADRFLDDAVEYYNSSFCEQYEEDREAAMRSGDLALITLADPLPDSLAERILPVDELSSSGDQYMEVYAVGFGESINRSRPGDKSYVALDLEERICTRDQSQLYGCRQAQEIIASRPPADTCFGDSGGPLYIQEKRGGAMKLLGITSRAKGPPSALDDGVCGSGGIYTSVEAESVRNWLNDNLRPDGREESRS